MKEKKINEFLALKLEKGKTYIYVNGKKFRQCKWFYTFEIGKKCIPIYDNIDSIDEVAVRVLRDEVHDITPEQEFWEHYFNLQAWYEHNYDTRLIHRYIAFPLLKALVDAGDPDAKRVFKKELAEHLESGHPNAFPSIFAAGLLDYFSPKEKKQFLQQNFPAILNYIEKITKYYPNMFLVILEERLLDYLNPEQKTQLKQLHYPVIVKWIVEMWDWKRSYRWKLYGLKEILFDHYHYKEEIKQIIQYNYSVILKDIKKIGKHYPNVFLYLFEERLLHYLTKGKQKQLIQQNYPVILNYVQETSKQYPDKFLYIFHAGILNYLRPKEKSHIFHQNYLIILKNIQKILKHKPKHFYPNRFIHLFEERLCDHLSNLFEERLCDHLSPEEKTQLIQQNFPVLLVYIKRITTDFTNDKLIKKGKSEYRISDETLCYTYLTVINAIEGTKLMDDFFNAIDESSRFYNVKRIITKVRGSIKKEQELKQNESEGLNENSNDIKTSNDNWGHIFTVFMNAWDQEINRVEEIKRNNESKSNNWVKWNREVKWNHVLKQINDEIKCNNCWKVLPPKSIDILMRKERVYCPNCGILNRRKFSFKVVRTYLEAKE